MTKIKLLQTGLLVALLACSFFALEKSYAENVETDTKVLVKKIEFLPPYDLEITLSDKAQFKNFILKNPDRLVVDIENAIFEQQDLTPPLPPFVSSSRSSTQQKSLRLVFDLKQKMSVGKTSFRKVKNQNFAKITIQLAEVGDGASSNKINLPHPTSETKNIAEKLPEKVEKVTNASSSPTYVVKKITKNSSVNYSLVNGEKSTTQKILTKKIPVIVIDAGHGGKDPGTIGDYARTKEKHVTLSYAKELKKSLDNTKFYKVFLTRDDDFFIPLRKRVEKARRLNADLFVSMHANSIGDSNTSGFSIYTLSEKSSDKQAELLAQKENRADIIAGVNFSGASPDIMKTLIDLSQRDSMNSSSRFANIVIRSVKQSEIKILQNSHRFAGFAVLTAPDVASVLIELGYLSNKTEEAQLNNLIYKRKIITGLVAAVDEYFKN